MKQVATIQNEHQLTYLAESTALPVIGRPNPPIGAHTLLGVGMPIVVHHQFCQDVLRRPQEYATPQLPMPLVLVRSSIV
jgi:hypothetical protein